MEVKRRLTLSEVVKCSYCGDTSLQDYNINREVYVCVKCMKKFALNRITGDSYYYESCMMKAFDYCSECNKEISFLSFPNLCKECLKVKR